MSTVYCITTVALFLFSVVVYLLSVSLRSLKIGNYVSYRTCRYSSAVVVNIWEKKETSEQNTHIWVKKRQKGKKNQVPNSFSLYQLTLDSAIGGCKQPPKYRAENGNAFREDTTGNGSDALRSCLSDRTISTMCDKIIDKSTGNFGISMWVWMLAWRKHYCENEVENMDISVRVTNVRE